MLKEVKVRMKARLSAHSCFYTIIWMKSNKIDFTREVFIYLFFCVRTLSKRCLAGVQRSGLDLLGIIHCAFGGCWGEQCDDPNTVHFHHTDLNNAQTRKLKIVENPKLSKGHLVLHVQLESLRKKKETWLGPHFECKWILHAFLFSNVIFRACHVYSSYI